MKTMKRFFLLSLAALLVLGTVSCKGKNPSAPPKKQKVPEALTWVICDSDATLNGKWSSYEVLKEVSKQTGITPELHLVKKDFSTEITTRILSDDYPDLFTLPLPDKNLLKLKSAMPHLVFSSESSVYSALPETVTALHTQQEMLWYVPGGFSTFGTLIPKEGVYVLSDALKESPQADITTFPELIAFAKSFYSAKLTGISDQLLLGPTGHKTLEHLFGMDTAMHYGLNGAQPSSPSVSALKSFYSDLEQAEITPRSLTDFDENAKPLIFIGEQDYVIRWNQAAHRTLYRPVNLLGTADGFLSAYPQGGSYATLIHDGKHSKAASDLVTHLLNGEVSKTLMLGFENTHWLSSNAQNDPVITNYQIQEMCQGNSNLWGSVGISVLPYLSSYGAVYPYLEFPSSPCKDLLQQELLAFVSPFSEEGFQQAQVAKNLEQNYP